MDHQRERRDVTTKHVDEYGNPVLPERLDRVQPAMRFRGAAWDTIVPCILGSTNWSTYSGTYSGTYSCTYSGTNPGANPGANRITNRITNRNTD